MRSKGTVVVVGFGIGNNRGEILCTAVFSVLVFTLFFLFTGANGLVLGNDPAVHLETAKYFLSTGSLPLSDILWLPPLYHLALATFISFTGASSVGQQMFLIKVVTALMDWLLVFSVYLIASKFFSKKIGLLASSLLLLCFPLYELNSWGGYTSLLSLSFIVLLFAYLALPAKSVGNSVAAFILAFSVVLTHQLATFVIAFVLPPFIIVVLVKSKGHYPKALIAAIVGAGIAFGIYYLGPILPYLGDLISIVFFQIKTMSYQIGSVSSNAFIMYFGFIIFFAFAGLIMAFFKLRKPRSLSTYMLMVLSFAVPFFFSQSYIFGFYLPFQWFVYYLLPALVILAAVTFSSILDLVFISYSNNKKGWKRNALRLISVGLIISMIAASVLHFQTVSSKLQEDTTYYSTSDLSAYQAGLWLKENNSNSSKTVVVSQKPGHWFWVYSGLNVTAETDPIIQWNSNAECVLDMSYEMQHPLTMVRFYSDKNAISNENYVSFDGVWRRATYFSSKDSFFSYRDQNGNLKTFSLSSLNKSISMDEMHYPNKIIVSYFGDEFQLTEDILIENDTYPVTLIWQLRALNIDLYYPSLFLAEYLDLSLNFSKANVAGVLYWDNPLSNPTKEIAGEWAISNFYNENLTAENQIDVYDEQNQIAYAINFFDLPNLGNVGSLWNGQIDAVRWQYDLPKLDANSNQTFSYQTLAFSMNSMSLIKNPNGINSLFVYQTAEPFGVECRNFVSIIQENNVGYIVYNVGRFDKSVLNSGWVQQVYSNDEYIILKIKTNHPNPNIIMSNG